MRQNINPTELDFSEWIASLNEPMKSAFQEKGLENCRGVLNFRRFILEGKDNGMEDFMKENLSPEDYDYWINSKS